MFGRYFFLNGIIVSITLLTGCDFPSGAIDSHGACPSVSRDGAPVIDVEPGVRIGGLHAGDDSSFGELTEVMASGRGLLYAVDGLNQQVSVFDASGEFLLVLGREGSGPGEFKYPTSLGLVGDTSVLVFDPHLWRTTVFAPDGTVISTTTPDATPVFGQVHDVRFSRTGQLFNLSYSDYQETLLESLGFRRKGLGGGVVTLDYWDAASEKWIGLVELQGIEVFVDLDTGTIQDVAFAKEPLWAVSPGGAIWYADNAEYRVFHLESGGDAICLVVEGLGQQEVTELDKDHFYDARDQPTDRAERARERRAGVPLPDYKPAISSLVAEGDSLVWVRTSRRVGDRVEWDVLRRDGSIKHRVPLPSSLQITRIRDGRIVGIARDSLGVDAVEVHDLAETSRIDSVM